MFWLFQSFWAQTQWSEDYAYSLDLLSLWKSWEPVVWWLCSSVPCLLLLKELLPDSFAPSLAVIFLVAVLGGCGRSLGPQGAHQPWSCSVPPKRSGLSSCDHQRGSGTSTCPLRPWADKSPVPHLLPSTYHSSCALSSYSPRDWAVRAFTGAGPVPFQKGPLGPVLHLQAIQVPVPVCIPLSWSSSQGIGRWRVSFAIPVPKRQCQRMGKVSHNCTHSHTLAASLVAQSAATACSAGRPRFNPWVRKTLRGKWQPTPVLSGKISWKEETW